MSQDSPQDTQTRFPVRDLELAVVASRFNAQFVDGLLAGCFEALEEQGVSRDQVQVFRVPGVFELQQAAGFLATSESPPSAIIALGAVIRGETLHYELLAEECVRSLAAIAREELVPVTLGVLTVDNEAQAKARSTPGSPANRGHQAALAALEMAALQARIEGTL